MHYTTIDLYHPLPQPLSMFFRMQINFMSSSITDFSNVSLPRQGSAPSRADLRWLGSFCLESLREDAAVLAMASRTKILKIEAYERKLATLV